MPDKKSPNLSLTKAYEKATGDGPIESTLEMTEEQLKKLIRAADKVILDAADTAKKVPGAILDAAETIVGTGIDGAKAAGKSWLGAVKSLGSFLSPNGGPGEFSFLMPAPKKRPERGPSTGPISGGKIAKVVPPKRDEIFPDGRRRPKPIIKPRPSGPSGILPGENLPETM